jgi:hypothetical protein
LKNELRALPRRLLYDAYVYVLAYGRRRKLTLSSFECKKEGRSCSRNILWRFGLLYLRSGNSGDSMPQSSLKIMCLTTIAPFICRARRSGSQRAQVQRYTLHSRQPRSLKWRPQTRRTRHFPEGLRFSFNDFVFPSNIFRLASLQLDRYRAKETLRNSLTLATDQISWCSVF